MCATLLDAGYVQRAGKRWKSPFCTLNYQEHRLRHQRDIDGNLALRRFWLRKAVEHLDAGPDWRTLRFMVLPIATSQATFAEIRRSFIRFYIETLAALERDDGEKTVFQLMSAQLFEPGGSALADAKPAPQTPQTPPTA